MLSSFLPYGRGEDRYRTKAIHITGAAVIFNISAVKAFFVFMCVRGVGVGEIGGQKSLRASVVHLILAK